MPILLAAVLLSAVSAPAAEPLPEPVETTWNLRVHLLSDKERVELRRYVAGQESILVCTPPCDAVVQYRLSDEFVFDGPGLLASPRFHFRPRNGDVTLRVSTGTPGPLIIGGLLVAGGGTATFIGGLRLALDATFGDVFCDQDPQCIAGHDRQRTTARTVLFVGLAALLAGGALMVFSPRTDFAVEQ